MQLIVSKDIEDLSWRVAEWMVDCIREVLETKDRFTLALSGGSTPKKLNLLLASDEFKDKVDWRRLHIFWGDERFVPLTDDRSNAKMAFDTLLDHVPVPKSQIHIMQTDIDGDESAAAYENVLKSYFPEKDGTSFDLVLLGLGDNAHTLSLFPGEEVIHEKNKWVRTVYVKEVNMMRITLTAPIVNRSKRIAFLVSGQDKADAVSHILLNAYSPDLYPAQVIRPSDGDVYWFLDEAAATRLQHHNR